MRNLVGGAAVAALVAVLLVATTTGGEYGWRVALAAVGLALWILGGLWKR